jgi:hypothetical protein
MKKIIIASIVGGLIIFLWQFFSYAAGNLHGAVTQYTEKEQAIMDFLATQELPEGGYIMPSLPQSASQQEWEELMTKNEGKPWAMIQYYKEMKNNMVSNMIRGFSVNIILVFIFCLILAELRTLTFKKVLLSSLGVGLIIFLNSPYTNHIWFPMFDIRFHLLDAIVAWGLTGVWLGWYLTRGKAKSY